MFCWTVQLKLVAGPVIHSDETDWIWKNDYSILADNILVTQNNILVTKQTHAMRLGTYGWLSIKPSKYKSLVIIGHYSKMDTRFEFFSRLHAELSYLANGYYHT